MYKILFAILVLNWAIPGIAQKEYLRKEIEKIIFYDTDIPLEDHHGFLVGVIVKDSTYTFTFNGSLKIPALDRRKYFELGGLSKVFTASLIKVLESQNKLDINEELNNSFPESYHNPLLSLTWKSILSHQSGFPKTIPGIGAFDKGLQGLYAHFDKSHLLHWYKTFEPTQGPPHSFSYSHLNYAILELALESKFDISYLELLNHYLLTPLLLDSLIVGTSDATATEYGFSKGGLPASTWKFKSFLASLGLKANLSGLLAWTKILLGINYNPLEGPLLSCFLPIVDTELPGRIWMGTGWYVMLPKRKPQIVLHAGTTSGHKAFIGFVPDTDTGVVILSRSPMETEDLGLLILRMINNNWKKHKRNG